MALPLFATGLLSLIVGGVVKAFLFLVGFIVVRFLLLIGFSYVTYQGIDYFVQSFLQKVIDQLQGMPEFIVNTLFLCKFDVAISIIFSAYAFKFSIKTASKATFFG